MEIITTTIVAICAAVFIGSQIHSSFLYKKAMEAYTKSLLPQVTPPANSRIISGIIVVPDIPRVCANGKIVRDAISNGAVFWLMSDYLAFLKNPEQNDISLLQYKTQASEWKVIEYTDANMFDLSVMEIWDYPYWLFAQDSVNPSAFNSVPNRYPIGKLPSEITSVVAKTRDRLKRKSINNDTNQFLARLDGILDMLTSGTYITMVPRSMVE